MRRASVSTDQLQQTWQNRQSRTNAVPVGALVRALVKSEGLDRPSPLADLRRVWAEAIGPELSRHSRPQGLRHGTLSVLVDSAAHLAELQSLTRAGLVEQVSSRFDHRPIKKIRLRLGHTKEPNKKNTEGKNW